MLVGLSGFGRSGKDSIGEVLARHHGFRTIAFADLMRACALALNPIVGHSPTRPCEHREVRYSDLLDGVGYERAKKDCPEVREFLQRLGTEMGRKVLGEDFWVDMTFAHMDLATSWAITDVRFKNEAAAIKEHSGYVVRVDRPGVGPANDHVSEHDLDDWPFDYRFPNDGTLAALADNVAALLDVIALDALL